MEALRFNVNIFHRSHGRRTKSLFLDMNRHANQALWGNAAAAAAAAAGRAGWVKCRRPGLGNKEQDSRATLAVRWPWANRSLAGLPRRRHVPCRSRLLLQDPAAVALVSTSTTTTHQSSGRTSRQREQFRLLGGLLVQHPLSLSSTCPPLSYLSLGTYNRKRI